MSLLSVFEVIMWLLRCPRAMLDSAKKIRRNVKKGVIRVA